MGRKKKINTGGVSVVKLDRQIPNTPVVRRSAFGWVNWGRRNDYPDLILGLYSQSPTLSACVNFCVTALIGGGVDYEAMKSDGVQLAPNYRYGYNELIRRCAFDYSLFGGFALQVVKNRDGRTYSIYHQPFNSVRSGERDSDGVVTDYYICRDWTATSKYSPVKIPSLTMRDDCLMIACSSTLRTNLPLPNSAFLQAQSKIARHFFSASSSSIYPFSLLISFKMPQSSSAL